MCCSSRVDELRAEDGAADVLRGTECGSVSVTSGTLCVPVNTEALTDEPGPGSPGAGLQSDSTLPEPEPERAAKQLKLLLLSAEHAVWLDEG
ncbi:uncharacterized protein V6R79_024232 [Siganus canaliculatus]